MSPAVVDIVETPVVEAPVETPIETAPVVEEPVIESKGSSVEYLPLNSVDAVDMPAIGATKLRKMIFESNELIVCPGVYDGLSARTAIETGFNALYMVSTPPRATVPAQLTKVPRLVPVPLRLVLASRIWPLPSSTRCERTPR